jgi:hypothetical protein
MANTIYKAGVPSATGIPRPGTLGGLSPAAGFKIAGTMGTQGPVAAVPQRYTGAAAVFGGPVSSLYGTPSYTGANGSNGTIAYKPQNRNTPQS